MKIEWVAPPADLRALVHTFYLIEVGAERIDEPTPAYSAQLSVYATGGIELDYGHGGTSKSDILLLNAPQLASGRIRVTGPVAAAGASLRPLGWAALVGQPVDLIHDQLVPPAIFASDETIATVEQWRKNCAGGAGNLREGLKILATILRAARHPVRPQHRDFVEAYNAWLVSELNPPVEALYRKLPFSQRQIQRLSRQFFGAPPTQVVMRHRAIRAAMLLSNPDLPASLHDELVSAYFDQAHMIRHIRRFTGRTPANLAGPSFATMTLDPAGHGETAEVLRAREE